MGTQSRRGLLKNAAKAAAIATGGGMVGAAAEAQKSSKLEKKAYSCQPNSDTAPAAPPLFFKCCILWESALPCRGGRALRGHDEEHTKHVLMNWRRTSSVPGSSMEKVLKVNVYLNDIKDWAKMNTAYAGRWGKVPPVRTTVAPAGGISGGSLVEIDLIAYI